MILSTGEVLADVPACGPDDVDRAVTAARRAFDAGTWSRLAPAQRKAVMLRFADGIEANLSELARLDAVDAGKPIVDCEELDLPDVVNTFRWYAEAVDKVYGKIPTAPITPMAMHSQNRPELLRAAQVSVGPLGVITAQVFLAVARYLLRN
jgi:acyl-CoA reductase-like NAD-dependent aldehyde dehydrogenase